MTDPTLTWRAQTAGYKHLAAAGHELAAQAAFDVLEAGGNAVDAGVAGGITLGVVQSELVNVAGVAPMVIWRADRREAVAIDGVGPWPAALDPTLFRREHGGHVPRGVLRTVVPAAPKAWIRALRDHGTMRFGDVAAAAIGHARDGFAMYPLMASLIAEHEADYREWPQNAAIYLPGGRLPRVGERFVQADLAASLQYMVDQEVAALSKGREAGLQAAEDAFYRGDLAATILAFHAENGGLLWKADLESYQPETTEPPAVDWAGGRLLLSGAYSQGPALGQLMTLLSRFDWRGVAPNSVEHLHRLIECIKIAFADREAGLGDPRFVDVPLERWLSAGYADRRLAETFDPGCAHPDCPMPDGAAIPRAGVGAGTPNPGDTSYIAVVDRWGNAFSATPSDVTYSAPIVPGTGLCPSSRGSASWGDPDHPNGARPGRRPRLTPNPAIWIAPDGRALPFGTPGADVQVQAMAQVLMNLHVFGLSPQAAVEAPRVASYSFPGTFEPHEIHPAQVNIESRIGADVCDGLAALGHKVVDWPEKTPTAGAVCGVVPGPDGLLVAMADPRRNTGAFAR